MQPVILGAVPKSCAENEQVPMLLRRLRHCCCNGVGAAAAVAVAVAVIVVDDVVVGAIDLVVVVAAAAVIVNVVSHPLHGHFQQYSGIRVECTILIVVCALHDVR